MSDGKFVWCDADVEIVRGPIIPRPSSGVLYRPQRLSYRARAAVPG